VVVSAVGDCTLGGDHHASQGASALDAFDVEVQAHRGDLAWFFSGVRSILAADDVTVANLEGTLTVVTDPDGDTPFHFRGKPRYAGVLTAGSVEVVNVANNHSHDFGDAGYAETLRALRAEGVGVAGNGLVDTRTVRGVEVKNLGYTGGSEAMTRRMVEDVARHKVPGNVVVVSFHWGLEGKRQVIPLQRKLGRMAIDAGADLVIGTHPHVIQGIETYRGRHVVYSLGNFVFGGNVNPTDKEAILYQETFAVEDGRAAPVASQVIPVRVTSSPDRNDFRPVPLEGEAKDQVLSLVRRLSEELQ
jgi:poly-gamma-glutamate synthesis protein (capsule biosynthesis protein)